MGEKWDFSSDKRRENYESIQMLVAFGCTEDFCVY